MWIYWHQQPQTRGSGLVDAGRQWKSSLRTRPPPVPPQQRRGSLLPLSWGGRTGSQWGEDPGSLRVISQITVGGWGALLFPQQPGNQGTCSASAGGSGSEGSYSFFCVVWLEWGGYYLNTVSLVRLPLPLARVSGFGGTSVCACLCFWAASVSSSKSGVLGQKEIPGTHRSAVSWVLGALVDLPLLFHLSNFSYVYFINTGYLVGEISRSTFTPSFWKQKFLDCLTFLISWILRF